jgi:hypothetical protein
MRRNAERDEKSEAKKPRHKGIQGALPPIEQELADARAEIESLDHQLSKMYRSTSWRITASLRAVGDLIKRISRRKRRAEQA